MARLVKRAGPWAVGAVALLAIAAIYFGFILLGKDRPCESLPYSNPAGDHPRQECLAERAGFD